MQGSRGTKKFEEICEIFTIRVNDPATLCNCIQDIDGSMRVHTFARIGMASAHNRALRYVNNKEGGFT